MKKQKIKKVLISLVCIYGIGSTVLFGSAYVKHTKIITAQEQTITEYRSTLDDKAKEVEELNATISEREKELSSQYEEISVLQSELDSARQENYELEREIEQLEKIEQELHISRGRVALISFTSDTNITNISIDNGDLLDLGLRGNLKGLGWDFVNAGIKYNIDPLFLAAISAQESGWGQYDHGNNNIFGISSGAKYFSSYSECIYYTAELLSTYYVGEGLYTPRLIQPKYCPSPDNWHYQVSAVANTILNGI